MKKILRRPSIIIHHYPLWLWTSSPLPGIETIHTINWIIFFMRTEARLNNRTIGWTDFNKEKKFIRYSSRRGITFNFPKECWWWRRCSFIKGIINYSNREKIVTKVKTRLTIVIVFFFSLSLKFKSCVIMLLTFDVVFILGCFFFVIKRLSLISKRIRRISPRHNEQCKTTVQRRKINIGGDQRRFRNFQWNF